MSKLSVYTNLYGNLGKQALETAYKMPSPANGFASQKSSELILPATTFTYIRILIDYASLQSQKYL